MPPTGIRSRRLSARVTSNPDMRSGAYVGTWACRGRFAQCAPEPNRGGLANCLGEISGDGLDGMSSRNEWRQGRRLTNKGGDAEPRLVKRFHAVPSAPLDVVVWGCNQHAFG